MAVSSVAVVDIGSNSIKALVAVKKPDGRIVAQKSRTLDARISAGISKAKPELSAEGMTRGLGAIRELLDEVSDYRPGRVIVVATSAVRDAANGAEFRQRVKAATKQDIRVLSGAEEAALIGRGLLCDPELAELRDFLVFDLGGGSLECLSFAKRISQQALSLPLGCVRLTEKFLKDPGAALVDTELAALSAHVQDELARSGFKLPPRTAAAVFTGGSMSTARAIQGAAAGRRLEETPSIVTVAALRALLTALAPLTLAQRKTVPGMPSARADVFPAALATMIAVAESAQVEQFHHSLYNLRWGLAAEVLGA